MKVHHHDQSAPHSNPYRRARTRARRQIDADACILGPSACAVCRRAASSARRRSGPQPRKAPRDSCTGRPSAMAMVVRKHNHAVRRGIEASRPRALSTWASSRKRDIIAALPGRLSRTTTVLREGNGDGSWPARRGMRKARCRACRLGRGRCAVSTVRSSCDPGGDRGGSARILHRPPAPPHRGSARRIACRNLQWNRPRTRDSTSITCSEWPPGEEYLRADIVALSP